MTSFASLGVPPKIVAALDKRGIAQPFPIQSLTIADALAGRDLSGRAPTGSGKTLAFAIPIAALVKPGQPRRPRALVLVPTRELASQVADELTPLANAVGRKVGVFYGGTNITRDQRFLRHGIDVIVATPGRLADLVQRRDCDLRDVDLVVLDEADRMADMGFLPEVQRLLDRTSSQRQTLLFSATLDGDVDVLVRRYQRNPVRRELIADAADEGDVRHFFWHAEPHDRVRIAGDIVRHIKAPTIVFTRTKHGADRVARQLDRHGISAVAIHGDRSQKQRERALSDFTNGRAGALVATDVAARGIHVDGVGVVLHFDPPGTDKDYVHRSGRTGRAGADGLVVTLVPPDKRKDVKALQRALEMPQHVGNPQVTDLGPAGAATLPARPEQSDPKPRQSRKWHTAGAPSNKRNGNGSQGKRKPNPNAKGKRPDRRGAGSGS